MTGNAALNQQQILTKAIQKAIDGGWTDYNSLESLELINTTANTVTLKGWVEFVDEDGNTDESTTEITFNYKELIFNHEFCKALWGDDAVDNNGVSLKSIQYWATQVAIKHLGKLHPVKDNTPIISVHDLAEIDFTKPPDELVEGTVTQYKLERMVGSIPFETHRIKEVNVHADSLPAYLHHLQQMVIAEDPIVYLGENI